MFAETLTTDAGDKRGSIFPLQPFIHPLSHTHSHPALNIRLISEQFPTWRLTFIVSLTTASPLKV